MSQAMLDVNNRVFVKYGYAYIYKEILLNDVLLSIINFKYDPYSKKHVNNRVFNYIVCKELMCCVDNHLIIYFLSFQVSESIVE